MAGIKSGGGLTWFVFVFFIRYIHSGAFYIDFILPNGKSSPTDGNIVTNGRPHFLFLFYSLLVGLGWGKRLRPARIREFIMKRVLLFMAALCVSSLTFAQVLVATLQHGDSVRAFYNRDAFVEAYNAAATGDVISLSTGNFRSCPINKDSLTIRGAGSDHTKFDGICYFGNQTDSLVRIHSITMEGIDMCHCDNSSATSTNGNILQHCNLDVHFVDVRFYGYSVSGSSKHLTGQFINCYIDIYSPYSTNTRPMLINCFVNQLKSASASTFINCLVRSEYASHRTNSTTPMNYYFSHETFMNSVIIFYGNESTSLYYGYTLPSTVFAQNCIGVKSGVDIFSQCSSLNCTMADNSIFNNMSSTAQNPYSLTDSAQAVYLGTDGTQIGLYGGPCPYSRSSLTYPIISRMNVAPHTTADGRLSVDIEVGYREETDDSNE